MLRENFSSFRILDCLCMINSETQAIVRCTFVNNYLAWSQQLQAHKVPTPACPFLYHQAVGTLQARLYFAVLL